MFESLLLDVSRLAPEAWEPIRQELQDIALLRKEGDPKISGRPFLRFHPTLASAAADPNLAQNPEIRQRFVDVYLSLMQALGEALTGSQPRAALEVLNREETNFRAAVQWAEADQRLSAAAALGHTFRAYLERSGRLRERDGWVQWLKDAVGQHGFTEEAAAYERRHAWTRFTQGDPQGAVDQLQALLERLRHTTQFDPAVQLAMATSMLGRVQDYAGASAQAIPILREAVGHWEVLVEQAGGRPWEVLLASPDHTKAASGLLGNLSATMGDLAHALHSSGHHNEALALAEKCVGIQENLGNLREVAADQIRIAHILMTAGRHDEAGSRYDLAFVAAQQVGDTELEGTTLQHQGVLADARKLLARASHLYQQALQRFQKVGNQGAMMQTYNLLGITEQKAGRLAEARAWYEKSRELALQLKDQVGLGQAAQNIGIAWQQEGEVARERGDEPAAKRHFEEARHSVEESLQIGQARGNKSAEAMSLAQLGWIELRLGNLDSAEQHALRGLAIDEDLYIVSELPSDYQILSEIAQARGDLAAAAEWAKKRDDLLAELKRRAGGSGLPAQMLQALQALAIACAHAGFGDGGLGLAEEEALARLDGLPAPFPDFAAFLRQIAAGQLSPTPNGLPDELRQWLEELVKAISDPATP